uniref:Uncharacterized protein n=1 Tax=Zea mays TaxID=4577 RepID=B6TE46_MAIZE|nr:hypothetical protein [Zea mays]|eukprot:NP_001143790.1 hypothetical protein [Zea mays]
MQASARLSYSVASRKVIAGVSIASPRSCYRTSRGKAHAAPLPAQEPPPKGQKRITKQERRVRIVEFVENYRASNEVEVTEHPMPKDEARVVESQGILEVSEHSMPKDDAEVAQPQGTAEVFEHFLSKDEGKVAQCQGTFHFPEHSRPKDDSGKTARHDMDTSETCKTADAPALSDLTENEGILSDQTESEDKPDPGNQQREIEANKFDLKNFEKNLNANDSNASDQSGSDMVNEAKTHARGDNPKLEESANTGLLGSLRSFAYGIRNFWKNM